MTDPIGINGSYKLTVEIIITVVENLLLQAGGI